ncbi:hypothetical protein BW687_000100 [Pseudomonas graminis]|uniref:hypothetical protein n=1 Tax=Pseudomonas graminis TaxID=158627 RepID=UPI002349099E|nr:hypothetical protein [Pseudomonas graminis]MDC6378590.1 hypothetical protein [Pseudomonas graminis]
MAIFEALSLLICFRHDAVKPVLFTPSNRLKPQHSAARFRDSNPLESSGDAYPVICVMSVRPINDKLVELLALVDIHRA